MVEDVTTTGGSAMKAVEAVRDAGGEVALVFTMVDREEGAADSSRTANLPFRALFRAAEFFSPPYPFAARARRRARRLPCARCRTMRGGRASSISVAARSCENAFRS